MKVFVVVSASAVLGLISVEGAFSSEERCKEFLAKAVPLNPGLQFFEKEVVIDSSRYPLIEGQS